MLRSKSRSGYLEFGQKKHSSSFILRSISRSRICRGDALASQVDKQALVSVDRSSVSLSENRIVKAAMMEKQLSDLETELKNMKARLDEAETERNHAVSELREVNDSLSDSKKELKDMKARLDEAETERNRAVAELREVNDSLANSKKELKNMKARLDEVETERNRTVAEFRSVNDALSNSKKEIESRDNEIRLLSNQLESAKVFEAKLGQSDVSLQKLKKRNLELEDELEKTKESESHMLQSLMLQTDQIAQTKMDLEESKLEVKTLNERLNEVYKGGNIAVDRRGNNVNSSFETKALTDQIMNLREQMKQLNKELKLQKDTTEHLRWETEESISAWSAKEMGFISCINKAYEENASLSRENHKLHEALVASDNTTRITREESSKLRELLKKAMNESSNAKEASNTANKSQAEYAELKNLLAEKEETIRALTKENDRLRITEVAAHENMKECKRILTARADANKHHEGDHTDVFNSPVGSLYEEHLDGRTTHQQMFSFDFGDMKVFNKDDDGHEPMFDTEEDPNHSVSDDDPEKAEALKGSIFDTNVSPKSEPHTPKTKGHHHRSTTAEEVDKNVHGTSSGHHHAENGDDKWFYMYGLYNRKKLFKKIGDIVGKNNSKKEGSIDHGKEHSKEQGKEQSKEQGKEQSKEQGKEQSKEQGKEQSNEQGKEQSNEQGKERSKEQVN